MQYKDLIFWKQVGQWFANPDLDRKGVSTSQKLNLVIRVEKSLRTTVEGCLRNLFVVIIGKKPEQIDQF